MLNRRILRIKAFKVLYSSVLSGNMTLAHAESQLDMSCEATRDLYLYMLGIVSPLTAVARERIEAAKAKFNPTEEELNPNMKFAENALATLLDEDPDFNKIFTIFMIIYTIIYAIICVQHIGQFRISGTHIADFIQQLILVMELINSFENN